MIQDWLVDPRLIIFPVVLRYITNPTSDPYLCPALAPRPDLHFKRLAAANFPVYVDAGTDERLWDEVVRTVENMRYAGIDVHFTGVSNVWRQR